MDWGSTSCPPSSVVTCRDDDVGEIIAKGRNFIDKVDCGISFSLPGLSIVIFLCSVDTIMEFYSFFFFSAFGFLVACPFLVSISISVWALGVALLEPTASYLFQETMVPWNSYSWPLANSSTSITSLGNYESVCMGWELYNIKNVATSSQDLRLAAFSRNLFL